MYEALVKVARIEVLRIVSVYLHLSLSFVLVLLLSCFLIHFDCGFLVLFVLCRRSGNKVMFLRKVNELKIDLQILLFCA